jgi:hypothetical protein
MSTPNSQPPKETTLQQARRKKLKKRLQEFEAQWHQLYDLCQDQESRTRLAELREQFDRQRRGVSEPAQAEVEVAYSLSQAGFSIAFLQESDARTADLECWLDTARLFVEITAIIPNPSARRSGRPGSGLDTAGGFMEGDFRQGAFVRRLLARMAEKSRQLSRYCAPVLLAVTVPNDELLERGPAVNEKLDLQRLAGTLMTTLSGIPQLSGVLLTCWNVPAELSRSNVRLSQTFWVTRSGADVALPRIRLLVVNDFATYALSAREIRTLKATL